MGCCCSFNRQDSDYEPLLASEPDQNQLLQGIVEETQDLLFDISATKTMDKLLPTDIVIREAFYKDKIANLSQNVDSYFSGIS